MSTDSKQSGAGLDVQEKARALVEEMTLDEKAVILTGDGWWQTHAIERLDIPSIFMTDGPHGLRKAAGPGLGKSEAATCFPTGSALASSWDPDLMRQIGRALALECQARDVQILLGPGINMKRSPLGGRNFEYFSEDPLLAGKLAAAYIEGVQGEGVGTCLKHFAVNNQEHERMVTSSDLDQRTLREIYLPAFEIAVKEARPWTVMTAYNPVNGIEATENNFLLQDVLRDEWGFTGCVISDWGAINDRIQSLLAGTNLEMPGSGPYNKEKIIAAVQNRQLPMARLDEMVRQLLAVILQTTGPYGTAFDVELHHELARRASADCMVLLKNDADILPIDPAQFDAKAKIALIGAFARASRIQGAGSSRVQPSRVTSAFEEFASRHASLEYLYAAGYETSGDTSDKLIEEARTAAKEADIALVFVGLPDDYESEAFDRASMSLPAGHNLLLEAVAEVQSNVVAVLFTGSAVEMPWASRAKAILLAGLGGQAVGSAVVDVLTGRVNPSGRLAETFPRRLEDTPTYPFFPGTDGHVHYGEGVFIGYRYYEKKKIAPLFPFGHGLSYTTFSYSEIKLSATELKEGESLTVEVHIKNTGDRFGKETVQLYVRELAPQVVRPDKELKAFAKVSLAPGEEQLVSFELDSRAFAHFDIVSKGWRVSCGWFEILVAGSSQDVSLKARVQLLGLAAIPVLTSHSLIKHFENHPRGRRYYRRLVHATNLGLLKDAGQDDALDCSDKKASNLMLWAFVDNMPVDKLPAFSGGKITEEMLKEILEQVQL